MEKALRVGVIGANPEEGGWARESHIPALQMLPGLALAAVAGRTQASADAAAAWGSTFAVVIVAIVSSPGG